jgi:uncharacterized protein YndB with AHSA1/START domain
MALSLRASVDVRAPAAVVFDLICQPERLPEWNVSIEHARRVEPEQPVGLGSRAICSGRLLGQSLESETEVIEFEPPRTFASRAIRGPRLVTRFHLEPHAELTRVTIDVGGELPGGRLAEMVAEGFLRREFTASLDRLRALSEQIVAG